MIGEPFNPIQAMRTAGLLAVTVIVAANVVPPLRRYRRWIGGVALVLYLIAGIAFFVIGWVW